MCHFLECLSCTFLFHIATSQICNFVLQLKEIFISSFSKALSRKVFKEYIWIQVDRHVSGHSRDRQTDMRNTPSYFCESTLATHLLITRTIQPLRFHPFPILCFCPLQLSLNNTTFSGERYTDQIKSKLEWIPITGAVHCIIWLLMNKHPVYQHRNLGRGCVCCVSSCQISGLGGLKREAIANPTPSH